VVPYHATIGPVDQVPCDSDQEEQRSRLLVAARVGDRNLSRGILRFPLSVISVLHLRWEYLRACLTWRCRNRRFFH
jgi:hypothetical protein